MHIRLMTTSDLDFAFNLTSAEGWSSTRQDFQELLNSNPKGSYICDVDGLPVGMVCTINYGEFGFIANLVVLPIYRNQSLGKILMEFAMKYLLDTGTQSLLLDGVPKAVPLYERLRFRKITKSLRMEAVASGTDTQYTRLMTENDLEEILAFDSHYFGSQRENFLRMRLSAYPELARVIEKNGEIQGFIMGSESGNSIRIGPWVMRTSNSLAEHLLLEFAGSVNGINLKIGVLESNIQALDLLSRYGFKERTHSWRMVYGKDTEATLSDHLYAIYSPARG